MNLQKALQMQVPFGTHKAEALGDLIEENSNYIIWLSEQYFVKKSYKDLYDAAVFLINTGELNE